MHIVSCFRHTHEVTNTKKTVTLFHFYNSLECCLKFLVKRDNHGMLGKSVV